MPKIHLAAAVLAITLTGCASPLQSTIGVVNALSAGSVDVGKKLGVDFATAEKACLVTADNAAARACLDRTEAAMVPALGAFDDFYALLLVVGAGVHVEEAREKAGGTPSLAQLRLLVPELLTLAARFTDALITLRKPLATGPATAKAVP